MTKHQLALSKRDQFFQVAQREFDKFEEEERRLRKQEREEREKLLMRPS